MIRTVTTPLTAYALLERTISQIWDDAAVRIDVDGAYEFRFGCATGWISVLETRPVMIRVTAHAAYDMDPSPRLWSELNEIQLSTLSAAVAWCDGTVFVSQTLDPAGVNRTSLAQAIRAVGGAADDIGPLLAGMFGGETPYPMSRQRSGTRGSGRPRFL